MSVIEHPASLRIRSGQGDYDVDFANGVDAIAAAIAPLSRALYCIDRNVLRLHPGVLAGVPPERVYAIEATEEEKTLDGVGRLASFLQANGASRGSTLVVIGGGIVQDIGAFAAHVYHRGIPYVLVPTTLLSMADSCIGAKTGVNLGSSKNQLGFFQSPARVLIWDGFVATLAPNDVRSGFGEVLKLAIIDGDEAVAWFERRLRERGFSPDGIQEAIVRSLITKQRVIEEDEYERELRKILNYGHTFGHALEGVTHHEVPHGLAVAWGVDVANFVAYRTGRMAEATWQRLHALVREHFDLAVGAPYAASDLLAHISRDKKAAAGSVTLVLPSAPGAIDLVPTSLDEHLRTSIETYLRDVDVFHPVGQ